MIHYHVAITRILKTALLLLLAAPLSAGTTLTVDPAGGGDFTTIQAALDSIPVGNRQRVVVEIGPGAYNERVRLDHDRVTLRGAGAEETRLWYRWPREAYHRRYDRFGPGVLNVFGDDVVVEGLTIENTQPDSTHAFALYGQPDRLILDGCEVLGVGGDTVSLWNTSFGCYYHRGCRFTGGVDFVCPRGWCFVRDSRFEAVDGSAMIWQDGHMDPGMKFALVGCEFDGPEGFWLGRNHYPSQFYLVGCRFTERMADKPIGVVGRPKPWQNASLWEQKYFFDCHRTGGDYAWHADNLSEAPSSPAADEITPAWTFGGTWDPESTDAPTVVEVETDGASVFVTLSEPVCGAAEARVLRADGSAAEFTAGDGDRRVRFEGGSADSLPASLEVEGESLIGAVATLAPRPVASQSLPAATPVHRASILLVGDSTVADYPLESPMRGWGQALRGMVDERVTVHNAARNGRSSESFRSEGRWKQADLEAADFVLIQFGHNDNPGKGPDRETDPAPGGSYRANLTRYVEEAREAGAVAVLVSPTARRHFTAEGQVDPQGGNLPYAAAVLAVAEELDCPVVDLNRLTGELFERLGEGPSDRYQPEGDRTHFTPAGARRVAALLLGELQEQLPELRRFVDQAALRRP
ncbi:Rhamnogalacturonan acetylesterase RhgT [Pseudobythopirellula maris]|uniref:Rhamnogalacturonan acetylesterase RhgT n=1 Tax=Pseudobythopirellula maris TaxID=2527991 RepID=A0A5C5ZUN0_9BACT|nr:pectinesterase family protein [Pseudobythopirellula maris]TWT89903.1 Rhamnogalacturonan acetylesterase RhgT [Pseudobythopirellula maris]